MYASTTQHDMILMDWKKLHLAVIVQPNVYKTATDLIFSPAKVYSFCIPTIPRLWTQVVGLIRNI